MPHSRGFRSKSRGTLTKRRDDFGLKVTRFLTQYAPGDKVIFDIDPSVHKGMPHRRYQGKVGVILQRRGRAYIIETEVGEKKKIIIARPEHIVKFG
jgi:large subunit ribosomal protein L21e